MSDSDSAYDLARVADLEAQIAAVEARLAAASKKPPIAAKTNPLRRQVKAKALVDWGIVDSMADAYAYLADMGE